MRATIDLDDKLIEEAKKKYKDKNKEGINKSVIKRTYQAEKTRTPYKSFWHISYRNFVKRYRGIS